MISYREVRPTPFLLPYVECFWFLAEGSEAGVPSGPPPIEKVLPDGCIELVFHLQDRFSRWREDGTSELQPTAFVVGQLTRFLLLQAPGRVSTMGVRFRPGRAHPFLGLPVSEVTGLAVPLGDIWTGTGISERMQSAPEDNTRVRIAESWLLSRLASSKLSDRSMEALVDAMVADRGRESVAQLASRAGLSPRQLERRFAVSVGLPPKAFSRIVRLQGALQAVRESPSPDWAAIALEAGYYDQPHLLLDFRELAGESPESIRRAGGLTSHFTSKERLVSFFGSAGASRV